MKIEQRLWTETKGWETVSPQDFPQSPQLVLVFGARMLLENEQYFTEVRSQYPSSHIVMCSTSGEILGERVRDGSLASSAILFEHSTVAVASLDIANSEESYATGKHLAELLPQDGLVHAMVFSDGTRVNGTALVQGLNEYLPKHIAVTGGLVGDAAEFKRTLVGLNQKPEEGKVVVVGFYGDKLRVGYGSFGGWDPFGVDRTVTKSKGNVLYELDGKPALDLYKTYLGDKADKLPGSGLLFPLRLRSHDETKTERVRTILAVNEADQSMTFAGDIPEGEVVTLMKANFDRLIDGASGAGSMSISPLSGIKPDLAILISCVGRKLVLGERTEEEVESVSAAFGGGVPMMGFYSYGELCPTTATEKQCQLHNQTMTITVFHEAE